MERYIYELVPYQGMVKKKKAKKKSPKMVNIWAKASTQKRLRKYKTTPWEPEGHVLDKILDRIDKVGLDELDRENS